MNIVAPYMPKPRRIQYRFDFIAGKRAGFTFVAVTTGYFKSNDFTRAGLKKQNILKSIKYLPSWVKKHGR